MTIQKDNRYKYLKSAGDPVKKVTPNSMLTSEKRREEMSRLLKYKAMWDAMSSFRKRRQRIKNYERGLQWEDTIEVEGKWITEAENIRRQGKMPLKNNVMLQTENSVVGVFRNGYAKPEAIARTRDTQHVGEMMTSMLQYISQINDIKEVDAADFMEGLRSGLVVQSVDYSYNIETRKKEVNVTSWNPSRVFMNSNVQDPRGKDITTIGVIMDLTKAELLQRFAKTDADEAVLLEIYKHVDKDSLSNIYRTFTRDTMKTLDFLVPEGQDLCRVIQAWELESEDAWLVWDKYKGEQSIYPRKDKAAIDRMIAERDLDIEINGLDRASAEITCDKYHDIYWYVRYLSPMGDVLYEGRSPFAHNDNPFAVYLSRLVDGEIFSFFEGIIDQQRYINRLITMIDFIMGASAKGVLVFPENAIPKGMSKEDILDQWVSYRGVIFADLKPGTALPQQISTNATNIGANEMLAMQMQLVRDISGVHGAILGKEAKSGTSGQLYAQEASNAQTNLLDLIESFTAFRKRRDYKIAKVSVDCYDDIDYIPIAGREYAEYAKEWDSKLAKMFDYYITITETNNIEVYEAQINQMAMTALQQQLIDFKTALEVMRTPYSDKLVRILERKEEEMIKQQAQQQQMAMAGNAFGQRMMEAGASEADVQQAGANIIGAMSNIQEGEEFSPEMIAQSGMADQRAIDMINKTLR